jgi:protein TonB
MATAEATLVPSGILKDKVQEGFIAVSVDPEQHVEGAPGFNALYYEHPGCSRWVVPLDDMELPLVGEERECSNCAVVLPIKTVEANGYVPPSQRQPEPQPDPEPEPEPRPEPEPKPTAKPRARRKPKAKTVAEPTTGAPVDEDEGDEEYASLLDAVDADYAVPGMPAPQDLENPPELGALEDPTEDEAGNRVLHMQYNALFARARYLYGIENAKARNCGRVRKRYMKPAMRAARTELGKDATQTEVVSLAENDEAVAKWTQRQERHADRADAYKTFMEIYAENVKTLSRDLTWAGAEERGS